MHDIVESPNIEKSSIHGRSTPTLALLGSHDLVRNHSTRMLSMQHLTRVNISEEDSLVSFLYRFVCDY